MDAATSSPAGGRQPRFRLPLWRSQASESRPWSEVRDAAAEVAPPLSVAEARESARGGPQALANALNYCRIAPAATGLAARSATAPAAATKPAPEAAGLLFHVLSPDPN